jgi:hypothetical protein
MLSLELEKAMSTVGGFRKCVMTTTILVAFSLGGALHAAASTDVYRDIRKPNGHERDLAAKQTDFAACGYPGSTPVPNREFPRFNKCMHAHDWVVDHVIPDPDEQNLDDPTKTVVHFDDLKKQSNGAWRGDAALQTDTRSCGRDGVIDYESRVFKQCMRSLGWRFAYTKRATEKTWQETDPDTGALLTCKPFKVFGITGSDCSNF